MKKINKLIFFTFIMLFAGMVKVNAATSIITYAKCTYMVDSATKTYATVIGTEVKTEKGKNSKLVIEQNGGDEKAYTAAMKKLENTADASTATYISSIKENSSSACPKYMYVNVQNNKKYISFSNDKIITENYTYYPVVGKDELVGGAPVIKTAYIKDGTAKSYYWMATNDSVCDGQVAVFFFASDKTWHFQKFNNSSSLDIANISTYDDYLIEDNILEPSYVAGDYSILSLFDTDTINHTFTILEPCTFNSWSKKGLCNNSITLVDYSDKINDLYKINVGDFSYGKFSNFETITSASDAEKMITKVENMKDKYSTVKKQIEAVITTFENQKKLDLCDEQEDLYATYEANMDKAVKKFEDEYNYIENSLLPNLKSRIEDLHNQNYISDDDYKQLMKSLNNNISDFSDMAEEMEYTLFQFEKNSISLSLEFDGATGCSLLSEDLTDMLKTILWYIKLAAIILAIVLSMIDYIKAVAGSDDKSMNAANKRFMTRFVLVIVLFLVPVLVEFALTIFHADYTIDGKTSIECVYGDTK